MSANAGVSWTCADYASPGVGSDDFELLRYQPRSGQVRDLDGNLVPVVLGDPEKYYEKFQNGLFHFFRPGATPSDPPVYVGMFVEFLKFLAGI